jgi:hypothetical protein
MIQGKHHAIILTSAAVAVIAGLLIWLAPSRRIPPEGHLPRPRHMQEIAQDLLRDRMKRHGEDMRALVMAVVLLDFAEAGRLAERVGSEPGLQPGGKPGELDAALPAGFFEVQSDLKIKATRLSAAAGTGEPTAVAEAYGALSQTCVGCHALYAWGGAGPMRPKAK